MLRSTPIGRPGRAGFAAGASVIVLFAALVACGPSEEERVAAARADAWAELQEDQAALNAKRDELAGLAAKAAESGEGEWVVAYSGSKITTSFYQEDGQPFMHQIVDSDDDAESGELREELTKRGDRYYLSDSDYFVIANNGNLNAHDSEGQIWEARLSMAEEVGGDGEALYAKLAQYINEAEWDAEGERSEEQTAAFGMKSAEDMELAEEYVVQGGDYRRAVEMLQRAQQVDPDNPDLEARLAEYQEARYITAERLAQVSRGMTQREVEGVLGKVYYAYVTEFPEENVVRWVYPKNPDEHGEGAAAAVYFRGDAKTLYQKDFNAIEGDREEE